MNKALSSVQNIQKPSLSNSVRLQISLSITCVQFSEESDNIWTNFLIEINTNWLPRNCNKKKTKTEILAFLIFHCLTTQLTNINFKFSVSSTFLATKQLVVYAINTRKDIRQTKAIDEINLQLNYYRSEFNNKNHFYFISMYSISNTFSESKQRKVPAEKGLGLGLVRLKCKRGRSVRERRGLEKRMGLSLLPHGANKRVVGAVDNAVWSIFS